MSVGDSGSGSGPGSDHEVSTIAIAESSQSPGVAREVSTLESPQAGMGLGRYLVVEELGKGGMGVVVRAYDPKLHREVALKRLRLDALSPEAEARLLREAQAMAQLSHPNVVAIYDVDATEDGVVLAMEYVGGQTLRRWLQSPRPRSAILERLIGAGQGLWAAHRAGLVHRDFKPSNVLIGPDGRAQVTDFGLARSGDPDSESLGSEVSPGSEDGTSSPLVTPLTEVGIVMGTPAYMPPEQHHGRPVDARSDQYAFCVTAWEALTGRRPYKARTLADLVHLKLMGPPAVPKDVSLPRWLVDVLRRGLQPSPGERWSSMHELLEALGRDPARRRRRRAVTVTTAGAIGLGVAALAWRGPAAAPCPAGSEQLRGVWDDARREEVERALQGRGSVLSKATWERVRSGLDDYAVRWAEIYDEACASTHVRHEQSEHVLDLRSMCLRQRRGRLDAAVGVLVQADAELAVRAIEAVEDLPDLGRCEDVEALLAEIPPPEDPTRAAEVAAIRERAARIAVLRWAGRDREALALVDDLLVQAQGSDYPPVEAELLEQRGVLLDELGRWDDAAVELRRAYEQGLSAGHDRVAALAAGALASLVDTTEASVAEGEIWGATAMALARRVEPDGLIEASVHNLLGSFTRHRGDYDATMEHYQRALDIRVRLRGPASPDVLRIESNLAGLLDIKGEYRRAEEQFRRVLELSRESLGPEHPRVAQSLHDLAICLQLQGRYADAEAVVREALALRERVQGREHPETISTRNDLGWILLELGRVDDAVPVFERALEEAERAFGPTHAWLPRVLEGLAAAQYMREDYDEAQALYERSLEIRRSDLGPDDRRLNYAISGLARIANARGDHEAAIERLDESLRIIGEGDASRRDRADTLMNLAEAEASAGRPSDAAERLRLALSIYDELGGPKELQARACFERAELVWDHDRAEARALLERARADGEAAGEAGRLLLERIEAWTEDHPEARTGA